MKKIVIFLRKLKGVFIFLLIVGLLANNVYQTIQLRQIRNDMEDLSSDVSSMESDIEELKEPIEHVNYQVDEIKDVVDNTDQTTTDLYNR